MAVITGPGGGTGARNKLGGVVYASWKGVQYMRSLRVPKNPRSPGQNAARKAWWCASQQWRLLPAKIKGYYDQLAALRVPVTSDLQPMPSGISGVYSGFNLHRFAYIRHIWPGFAGVPWGFVLDPSGVWFQFSVTTSDTLPNPLTTQARVWYMVRPTNVWTRGTADISYIGPKLAALVVRGISNIPAGTTGADMAIVFDFPTDATPATATTVCGSSMPDGRFYAVPDTYTPTVPTIPDPCAIPT